MKYMLLIYDNAKTRETFLGEEGEALMAEVDAIMKELTESGELVGGEALADPSNTRTIRVVDGAPAITDGPFAEAKEHLGGYLIVDCESAERAAEIAPAVAERALLAAGGAAADGHRRRGDVSAPDDHVDLLRAPGAAGPRHPRPPLRALRRVRGRRAGGAARRRGPVAAGGRARRARGPGSSRSPRAG